MTEPRPLPSRSLGSGAWALGLLALWLLATAALRPLLLPDEGRYAEVAREMMAGDALVPTLNGLPFFHKPPLMYWLDVAAMRLVGIHEFAARFAPALGAWLMGAALFLALRRWHGARTAAVGLLVLATCPFFFVAGQYANHDMLVAGLITVALLCLARAVDTPDSVDRRWALAGWCACAFAVLAKGLIGIVLPVLVLVPWLLAQGRWRAVLGLLHPFGPLAFVALAAPWFVAMQQRFPGFFDYFFVEQHFRRFAQANFNNAQPFWFYLAVLPALTLPWSIWLPAALRRGWAGRGDASPAPRALLLWWIVAVVGFFSLPSSKIVGYVLPVLAPLCALLAPRIAAGRAWRPAAGVAALACVAIVVALTVKAPASQRELSRALAERLVPGERVVMVDEYFYDLPFYARLAQPALVASDWAAPDLARYDNWRKELADAARFDAARGRELLWPIDRLAELPCRGTGVWFVAAADQWPRLQAIAGIERVLSEGRVALWHAAARRCE